MQKQIFNNQILTNLFAKLDPSFMFPVLLNPQKCPLTLMLGKSNYQGLNILLREISSRHSFGFSSVVISQVLPQLISKKSLTGALADYLEKRFIGNDIVTLDKDTFKPVSYRDYEIREIDRAVIAFNEIDKREMVGNNT